MRLRLSGWEVWVDSYFPSRQVQRESWDCARLWRSLLPFFTRGLPPDGSPPPNLPSFLLINGFSAQSPDQSRDHTRDQTRDQTRGYNPFSVQSRDQTRDQMRGRNPFSASKGKHMSPLMCAGLHK